MNRSVIGSLLGAASLIPLAQAPAFAQASSPAAGRVVGRLEEIVVTAQKRSQRLQDVPIAITAISQATLQANRITSSTDLNGVAPNVTVRESGGSIGIPAFGIRGLISYGVVPGSDKETSIYLDGVYIGSPNGSNFELPDIERIEVLRGPQGTLFGRNATAGAISIITRDPAGQLGGRQEFTFGNYKQFRTRTSVDLPSIGPFSAYLSYVHNQRNGDIRNLGAGQVWDRTGPNTGEGIQTSPRYLGSHDSNSYFVALKYQPTDAFKSIYKFDYSADNYTPDGIAAIAVNPAGLGPLGGGFLNLVLGYNAGNYLLDPSARRPEAVNNAFTTNAYEKTFGHNLTSSYQINDTLSVKNILAYRQTFIFANTQLDGLGGLNMKNVPGYLAAFGVPNAGVDAPFEVLSDNAQSRNRQFSDELQANYTSHLLTVTTGLLFFHQNSVSGAPPGLANEFILASLPGGRLPLGTNPVSAPGGWSTSFNHATSLAAYSQVELHITQQVDLVGGLRVTDDRKSGSFIFGGTYLPASNSFAGLNDAHFTYQQTKPAYSFGVNYKPARDFLLYGKYSDSFVSGGAIGGVAFKPETASSFEVGGKADFFQHHLRTNISLFDVEYRNLQSAQGGSNVGFPQLGAVIIDQGNANAKGAEFEVSARPISPVTLGGSLGYTDVQYTALSQVIKDSYAGAYVPTLIPKWTADLSAQYESDPLWHGARFVARMDTNWHSRERVLQANVLDVPGFAVLENIPATWMVNARVSLADIDIGGHTMEVAGWAKNLTQSRVPSFPLAFGSFDLSSSFVAARTYGIDLSFQL